MEKFFDLGAMSREKESLIDTAKRIDDHDCDHPLTSHTGTEATWPWRVCAHRPCPCKILVN